jgi:ubiquinone/menaquinone biosynthesis C-methylase UbiE
MSHTNAWANPSKAGAADAVQMAAFLEARSQAPDMRETNRFFCEIVAARPGERLLEIGSGNGILCRMLAPRLKPGGSIVGLDISVEMAAEAGKYAAAEGVHTGISFESGAAEALPYPAACFDGVLAARLLLHAADPGAVLSEMKRVLKPGGRAVVMDWDFGTVSVDHPERDLTCRLLRWRCDHHGGDNWSGRQLFRRMHDAGFQDLSVQPWVSVACGEADGLTLSLWRAAQLACEHGAISGAEKEAWVKTLEERLQAGSFFASIVYFIVKGSVAPA